MQPPAKPPRQGPTASLIGLLRPYWGSIGALVAVTILANALNLAVPRLIAMAIDGYGAGEGALGGLVWEFGLVMAGVFIFTYLQSIVQTLTSERVARDLRTRLVAKIAHQDFAYIQGVGAARLLTNLTSDVDATKNFVAQAIASIVSSLFLIVGAAALLLLINWQLAAVVLLVVPIIGATFYFVLTRVRKLFRAAQAAIDWLNKVINESIIGSSLIRLLNAQSVEYEKFIAANARARDIGLTIIKYFSALIPIISFSVNMAILAILSFGGHLVITANMSLGDFTAFLNYLIILIFPILIIGFMSNVIAQAGASYDRISQVLNASEPVPGGTLERDLGGDIALEHLTVTYGEKFALKDVSLTARAGTRTAIVGPTAAGKTQLLFALSGLVKPQSGRVLVDGVALETYSRRALRRQIGLVFQDSVLFNLSLRENIAFSATVRDVEIEKAVATAELADFVKTLPLGLDTIVSERGTSLSGGQKQRIMLARALALNPAILLLDDFTARVDTGTERRILANVRKNYPSLTLISVTQKIGPVEHYDQIIVLMEGQVLAVGTHPYLLATSPEYVQIYSSQQSTEDYELQT